MLNAPAVMQTHCIWRQSYLQNMYGINAGKNIAILTTLHHYCVTPGAFMCLSLRPTTIGLK